MALTGWSAPCVCWVLLGAAGCWVGGGVLLSRSRAGSSTIGAGGLNGRVRDGTGCGSSAIDHRTRGRTPSQDAWWYGVVGCGRVCERPLAAGRETKMGVVKPLGLLVPVSCTCYQASTSGLSTQSSPGGLTHTQTGVTGDLILERASRLDAFSASPDRTQPTSRALGRTTGTPEVRPSRSSRTRDSPPQISYAHGG